MTAVARSAADKWVWPSASEMQPQKADVALRSSEWNIGSRLVHVSLFLYLSPPLSLSLSLSFFSYISLATGLRFPINERVPLHDPHHRALSTVMVFRSWLPCLLPERAAVRCILARCRRRCKWWKCMCVHACVCCVKRRDGGRDREAGGIREKDWARRYCRGIAMIAVRNQGAYSLPRKYKRPAGVIAAIITLRH